MTLAATWLEAEQKLHGRNKTEARLALNEATGYRCTPGDIHRWEQGERFPRDPNVRRYMLCIALPFYLHKHRLSKMKGEALEKMVEALL